MGTEKKSGKKIETHVSKTLHKKFKSACRLRMTNMAQVIRDAVQAYVKR